MTEFSREALYELVWSKPILEVARDFGLSDVAIAKRCWRLDIPVPGRGYWARIAAGQKPARPSLLKREARYGDAAALRFPESVNEAQSDSEAVLQDGLDPLRSRIAALSISPTPSIVDTLPAVKRTALQLKHPRKAELTFQHGEKSGPLVALDVSEGALDRALLVADTLLRAAQLLDWTFVAEPPKPADPDENHSRRRYGQAPSPAPAPSKPPGHLLVDGERIHFCIEERMRDEACEPTAAELAREKREYRYRAPRKVQVPTGNLRIVRLDPTSTYGQRERESWYDHKARRVEDQLKDVLLGFQELAVSYKLRRAEEERAERERQVAEKLKEEHEARQAAHAKLIRQLERDAGAWHRARYLRRYVTAARKAVGSNCIPVSFAKETVDFLEWAQGYVDQLDPLTAVERSEEFVASYSGHYVNELDQMKAAFGRLLGSEWQKAWKLGADYSPPPKSEEDRWGYSYRKKSVFEVGGEEEEE